MPRNVQLADVPRHRLLDKIDTGERLTLLHAPTGYGKSTTLAQWARRIGAAPLRATPNSGRDVLDRQDIIRPGLGIRSGAKKDVDGQTAVWLAAWQLPQDPTSLADQLPANVVTLIVDDYQQVSGKQWDEQILRLLEDRPGLRVVLSSRSYAFLGGPLVPARVPTTVLGWKELRFSAAESLLLAASHGLDLPLQKLGPEEEVAWPQGLRIRLLKQVGVESDDPSPEQFALWSLRLIEDPLEVKVLRAAAICPWIGPDTLTKFFGVPEGGILAAMRGLEKAGLIVVATGPLQSRVAVHPALGGVLADEARAEFGPSCVQSLLREFAAQLALVSPHAAVEVLMDADDFVAADRLAPIAFGAHPASGANPAQLVRRLSLDQLGTLPVLLQLRMMSDRFDPRVPIGMLPAEAGMLSDAITAELLAEPGRRPLVAQGILLFAMRARGKWEEARRYAKDYQARLGKYQLSGGPKLSGTVGYAQSIVALTALLSGEMRMAEESAQAALVLASASGYGFEQVRAHGQLALVKALRGLPEEAAGHLEEELGRLGQHSVSPADPSRIDGTLARLVLAYYERDPESVRDLLAALAPTAHRLEQWPIFVAAEGALLRQLKGDHEAFSQMRARLQEYPSELPSVSPFWHESIRAQMANLATYSAQYSEAHQTLGEASGDESWVWVAARARLALFEGRLPLALKLVAQGLELGPGPRVRHELLLMGAAAAFSMGDSRSAWDFLGQAGPGFRTASGHTSMSSLPFSLQRDMYEQWRQHCGDASLLEMLQELPARLRPEVYVTLSSAEVRTLQAVRQGRTVRATAKALRLSPNTVKSQLRASYKKLGVTGRDEALEKAERLGVSSSDDAQPRNAHPSSAHRSTVQDSPGA